MILSVVTVVTLFLCTYVQEIHGLFLFIVLNRIKSSLIRNLNALLLFTVCDCTAILFGLRVNLSTIC